MRQLGNDFLACLLVLILALAGIGAGRHAVPVATADGFCLSGSGGAPPGSPERHECAECLAGVVATLPAPAGIGTAAPAVDDIRPPAVIASARVARADRPGIRAPPSTG
jgi:hypothetical protein